MLGWALGFDEKYSHLTIPMSISAQ
jgi:hypothetical protein